MALLHDRINRLAEQVEDLTADSTSPHLTELLEMAYADLKAAETVSLVEGVPF